MVKTMSLINKSVMKQLDCDYLIVGSGAVGMAFADVILTETNDRIILVDQCHKPGGHWNMAYPFVTLHQPSQFYGVSSKELSKGKLDPTGWNKGLGDLATGHEICAYYEDLMRYDFLPSGRVQYFPMHSYTGDNQFKSLLNGQTYHVHVRKKFVEATYLKTSIPSSHTPSYSVSPGVWFMPINGLVNLSRPARQFVIIGGGKTGIDACLWLLQQDVDPDNIIWIVSREGWLLDRKNTQPSMEFFAQTMSAQVAQFEAIAASDTLDELFARLEHSGVLQRIDQNITPTMFHGATVSQLELAQLRRITHVIRMGKVLNIDPDQISLTHGTLATHADNVHVDCSASAISNLEMKAIFDGNRITPQTVRSYQPVFSAAFIAHVEVSQDDEKKKNELCQVVPLPNHHTDWLRMMSIFMMNQYNWNQDKGLRQWLYNNRLDGFSKLVASVPTDDVENRAILKRLREIIMPAMMKLPQLLAQIKDS